MNVTTIVVIGTLAASSPAGQQPDGSQTQTQDTRPAPDPRRQDIRMMERALTDALQNGAREVARLLKMAEPTSAFVTGTGRARGFILDGYGMFFDVDVPGMKQSAVWSSQMVQLAQDRERALQVFNEMRPDDPRRPLAMQVVRQIVRLMEQAQAGQVLVPPTPAPTAPTQVVPRDRITATDTPLPVAEAVTVASPPPAASPTPPAPPPAADVLSSMQRQMPEVRDPNELYTEAVKGALIDAMLRYSQLLKIGENEWLTVAASDSDGPQVPGQLDDTSRILISIRGSDLAAFQAGKLTREEVRKKVQVREF